VRSLVPILTLLVAMTAGACTATSPEATDADMKAIHAARTGFEFAMIAGDIDKAASAYAPDAVRMLEHQPAIMGRDAIVADLKKTMASYKLEPSLNPQETKIVGDWAFERGLFMNHVTPTAGGPMTMEMGKYILIFQKQPDGSWQFAREISNLNEPRTSHTAEEMGRAPGK
jgi:ketosteroid isomerase-like protein